METFISRGCRYVLIIGSISIAAVATGTEVGTSHGDFIVSALGAATYSMPLVLPPGIGKMTPQLALNYSSIGPDQFMGPGWSLSGLSQISRCGRTYAQNGVNQGVSATALDRFCLDGQQLVTTSTYGAVGAQYRTEVETFNRVTAEGGSSGNPTSFTVQTRSGLTLTYGKTYRVSNTVLGLLSPGQISEYHQQYFQKLGLPPSTFGGSIYFFGHRGGDWCTGCDSGP